MSAPGCPGMPSRAGQCSKVVAK